MNAVVDLDKKDRFSFTNTFSTYLQEAPYEFGFEGVGAAVYYRCVSVGTKILTKDLRWVLVEDLSVGDELVGIDEYATKNLNRRFQRSVVESTNIAEDDCLTVSTDRGDITVNYKHPFLAKDTTYVPTSNNARWHWIEAKDLTSHHVISFVGAPWETEDGDSWLAGMCDGEGCINRTRVNISQRIDSPLYDRIITEVGKRDVPFSCNIESVQHRNHLGIVGVNGVAATMRFLGVVRPQRLLSTWMKTLDAKGIGVSNKTNEAQVQNVSEAGKQKIVELQTSTRTFISNGFVSHNSYANPLENGQTEQWPDTILRSITGAMTILKWHTLRNRLPWDEAYWNEYAMKMARSAFDRKWLPPGRGIQHSGKELIYNRGAAFLQNCCAVAVKHLSSDAYWLTDMALCGVGVGFSTYDYHETLQHPAEKEHTFVVPDTREGWAESIKALIESYEQGSETLVFDYSLIRPPGAPIKSIGGVAPGSGPLVEAHTRLRQALNQYANKEISSVRIVADVMNIIGCAVVSGGQRRTALIALGLPGDTEFANLKNYGKRNKKGEFIEKGPSYDRLAWGYASNNSIVLKDHDDFSFLPDIADNIRQNGEPGVLNLLNLKKYARMTDESYGEDPADLINPCGEQGLEDKEVCCLSEVYYMNTTSEQDFYDAIEYATMYASIITLLPTHDQVTNEKIYKNRRIGVSISGVAEAIQKEPSSQLIRKLRQGYKVARQVNDDHARRCGVPSSIRVTTVKPSGSTSLVAGSSAGLHYPMYGRYIRRMRVQNQSPVLERLAAAGIPHEADQMDTNATVFEFPVNLGPIRGQKDVSMWSKGAMAVMMQRHWSDNATSVTVTFDKKKEGDQIEDFLAFNMPNLKSVSMLPEYDPDEDEVTYTQLPYEEITLKQYDERKSKISSIDWRGFEQTQIEEERFCTNDSCAI
jgi:ribonucleoside-diphosphate reductase alpha chain